MPGLPATRPRPRVTLGRVRDFRAESWPVDLSFRVFYNERMRRGVVLLILLFALGSLGPGTAAADYWRCYRGCKARIRACKESCKRSGARWKVRRRCFVTTATCLRG